MARAVSGQCMSRITPALPWARHDPAMPAPGCTGLGILDALEAMHREGFIHRDVKPANFCLHPRGADPTSGVWRVIDFGIARCYVDDCGTVQPARTNFAEFRGSTSYASINAHYKRDLGALTRPVLNIAVSLPSRVCRLSSHVGMARLGGCLFYASFTTIHPLPK